MPSANKARIKRVLRSATVAYNAYVSSLSPEQFREHALRLIGGSAGRASVAAEMRQHGYTDDMIERGLNFLFPGE